MKRVLTAVLIGLALSGCSTLVSNAASGFSNNLSAAVLNHDDPETVRDGIPTLLLTMDSLIEGSPEDSKLLSAGATLYATYGGGFIDDKLRASKLTTRARRYSERAICQSYEDACRWSTLTYDDFVASLQGVEKRQASVLYTYGYASLAFLRAHSSDWDSLAELPKIEALFEHYLNISGDEVNSSVYTYMGIMLTLRPPALGGEPERAREFFERAIRESNGNDLSAKVEYAKGYAKLLYERELHDRLLSEVLGADPNQNGFVLSNVLAQEEAIALMAEADDYF